MTQQRGTRSLHCSLEFKCVVSQGLGKQLVYMQVFHQWLPTHHDSINILEIKISVYMVKAL